jgi:hypothetical protein
MVNFYPESNFSEFEKPYRKIEMYETRLIPINPSEVP